MINYYIVQLGDGESPPITVWVSAEGDIEAEDKAIAAHDGRLFVVGPDAVKSETAPTDILNIKQRLLAFGDVDAYPPNSREASETRRRQGRAPRFPAGNRKWNPPGCFACEGKDAGRCPLHTPNWRLCPHRG